MDIGRLQTPEPGGRKDPKVEAARARDAKRVEGHDAGARAGRALDAQDSVSFSAEAFELQGEVKGFVEQLRRLEAGRDNGQDAQRLAEVRAKLEDGHYENADVITEAARRLHGSWTQGPTGV